jgi:dihydrofolate reductase
MGKLIIRSGMTVDGVIDQTDRWFIPEGEHEDESYDQLIAADAFVLGRPTYQGPGWRLADHYRRQGLRRPGQCAAEVRRLPHPDRAVGVELDPDQGRPAEGARELKREHSGFLLSYGCGELARYLTAQGLVDEIRFTVFATVLGGGVRPFGGGGPVSLRLTGTTMFRSGVALLTYRPEVA